MTLDPATRQNITHLQIYATLLGQDIPAYEGEPHIDGDGSDSMGELVAWADRYEGTANPEGEQKAAFNQEVSDQLSLLNDVALGEFNRAGFTPAQVKCENGHASLVSSYNGRKVSFAVDRNLISSQEAYPSAFQSLGEMLELASKAIDEHGAVSVSFNNQRMDVKLANGSLSLHPPQVNEYTLSGAATEYARHIDLNPKISVLSSGDMFLDSGHIDGDADEYSLTEKNQREASICNGRGDEIGATAEEIKATLESAYRDTFDETSGSYLDRAGYASAIATAAVTYAKKGILSYDTARGMVMRLVNDKDPRRVGQGISVLGQMTGDMKSKDVLVSIVRNSDNGEYVSRGIYALANMLTTADKESPFYTQVLEDLSALYYDLDSPEGQRKFACLRNLDGATNDNNARLVAEAFREALNWS